MSECEHPDLDAAGNCKLGCGFNSDAEHYAAIARGEDVYGYVPDAEPVPVPDRVLLPAPDGRLNSRLGAWWRLSEDEIVRARPGQVDVGFGYEEIERIERDALAMLAACAWARGRT